MSRQTTTAQRAAMELISHTAARYAVNAAVVGGPYIHLSAVFADLAVAVTGPAPAEQVRAVGQGLTPPFAEIVGDLASLLEAR